MLSGKNESLTSSFQILISFIYFCFLIAEARTSSTMLNNSGESGHPCHVPDFRRQAVSFSPLRVILAVESFVYNLYDVEVYSFYPYFLERFYQERMLYFVKCFSCFY